MSAISYYILLGLLASLYFEAIGWYMTKYGKTERAAKAAKAWGALGILEKIVILVIWPVSCIIFVIAIIRASLK